MKKLAFLIWLEIFVKYFLFSLIKIRFLTNCERKIDEEKLVLLVFTFQVIKIMKNKFVIQRKSYEWQI